MISRSPHEIELKLLCAPASHERLKAAPCLVALSGSRKEKHLRTDYYDTEDLALSKVGIALRLRHDGRKIRQTLKVAPATKMEILRNAIEIEDNLEAAASKPDLGCLPTEWRSRIEAVLEDRPLEARLTTDIHRITYLWKSDAGDEVEIAFDQGEIVAGDKTLPLSEVELELKSGHANALYGLALDLLEIAPLHIGTRSKAERGFDLLEGMPVEAIKAANVDLPRQCSLEEAYAEILEQCLGHLLSNAHAMTLGHHAEALHQARVALRRMRSAFSVFGGVIGGDTAETLSSEAKWLGGTIGKARDLDVFMMDILGPVMEAHPDRRDLQKLRAEIEKMRGEAWKQASGVVASTRYTRFLLQFGQYVAAMDWRPLTPRDILAPGSAHLFADDALDKRLSRVLRLGRDIADLDIEDRHELRKRLKKLRYTLSFFVTLYGKGVTKSYLNDLGKLQDVFGALNDVAMAEHLLERATAQNPELAKAAGVILDWHEARARKDWKAALKLWQRFERHAPFWRGE
ncbi:MAG: CHAD domain-containing protein [Rhizobiales bacterium]|nr:CHAD domain-containing protein [Hyphomicrobiales bacterium]